MYSLNVFVVILWYTRSGCRGTGAKAGNETMPPLSVENSEADLSTPGLHVNYLSIFTHVSTPTSDNYRQTLKKAERKQNVSVYTTYIYQASCVEIKSAK